jgi:hypothetical protein
MSNNVNKTKEEINTMLNCLLSKDSSCKNCKNCESVDACCFLMGALFVSQYIEKSKSYSTS